MLSVSLRASVAIQHSAALVPTKIKGVTEKIRKKCGRTEHTWPAPLGYGERPPRRAAGRSGVLFALCGRRPDTAAARAEPLQADRGEKAKGRGRLGADNSQCHVAEWSRPFRRKNVTPVKTGAGIQVLHPSPWMPDHVRHDYGLSGNALTDKERIGFTVQVDELLQLQQTFFLREHPAGDLPVNGRHLLQEYAPPARPSPTAVTAPSPPGHARQ